MRSVEHNIESIQHRVGSLYYPNNPISGSSRDRTLSEMYLHAMHTFGKMKTPSAPSGVTLDEYRQYLTIISTTLERSNALQLTGVPVNASRVAEVRCKIGPDSVTASQAAASDQIADSWLSYVRLVRVFINNVEIEE